MHLTRVATVAAVAMALPFAAVPIGVTPAYAQGRADMPGPLSSDTIRALQEALNSQGIKVTVDGVMGGATRDAIRSYQSQHHLPVTGMPDQATLDKLGVTAERRTPGEPRPGPRAQQQMGQGQMGPGQMGQGPMVMMGSGMMGPQMMQMMHQMMGGQGGMGGGMMGGAGRGSMMGGERMDGPMAMGTMAGLIYGGPAGEMTSERVTKIVDGVLAWHGNPRLKLGTVSEEAGEIIAEIVTQDGSPVQKLAFNRYPGIVRPLP
jgi:hypothetical protein